MSKFPKNIVTDEYIYYEGYRGDLVFNKVMTRDGMYYLKKPIVQKNVSIYAVWDIFDEDFVSFDTNAKYCPHADGVEDGVNLKTICIGDMSITSQITTNKSKTECLKVVQLLSCINLTSLPHLVELHNEQLVRLLNDIIDDVGFVDENAPYFNKYLKRDIL